MASERVHAAIVLAAGGSRRLGQSKQQLRRDGQTLLARTLRSVAATAPQRVVLVLGADHVALAALARDALGVLEIVINPDWEQGLSGSLAAARHALREFDGTVLVLGCDQPALDPEHLRQLLELAYYARSGCAATVHGDRFGLPVAVSSDLLHGALAPHGDRGLGNALNALPRAAVGALDAPELGFDIDTPDDLRHARATGLIDAAEPGPR